MSNILTDEFEKAASFRQAILNSNKYDRAAMFSSGLCRRLAAANTNDPQAVSTYERLQQDNPDKLHRSRWGVMSSIGYGFTPDSPDDVVRAIVQKVRAA